MNTELDQIAAEINYILCDFISNVSEIADGETLTITKNSWIVTSARLGRLRNNLVNLSATRLAAKEKEKADATASEETCTNEDSADEVVNIEEVVAT